MKIYVQIDVPDDWEKRLDMQQTVEREIKADRWAWFSEGKIRAAHIAELCSVEMPEPLTQKQVVDAFCALPHNVQYVSIFDAGVRFAEKHHNIGAKEQ
jgi:hypothetical protein